MQQKGASIYWFMKGTIIEYRTVLATSSIKLGNENTNIRGGNSNAEWITRKLVEKRVIAFLTLRRDYRYLILNRHDK